MNQKKAFLQKNVFLWIKNRQRRILFVAYNTLLVTLAFGLAFIIRLSLYLLYNESIEIDAIRNMYLEYFSLFLPYIFILSLIAFSSLAFIQNNIPSINFSLKKRLCLNFFVTSLIPLCFSFLLFLKWRDSGFSRGVILLFWFFSGLFSLLPPLILKLSSQRRLTFLRPFSEEEEKIKGVLIIGGAGYIGSQLCRELLGKGYYVRVLDILWFGSQPLADVQKRPNFELIQGDYRNLEVLFRAISGMDAVIHLGGIVGDPACEVKNETTIDINILSTSAIVQTCKLFKVKRFLFASSCSVYGETEGATQLQENSNLNPVSLYAKTKIASENFLLANADANFCPVILRFSTLFGLSPRPRFDLVLNIFVAKALIDKKIHVFGGKQWRPMVHVLDVCKSIHRCLTLPKEKVSGQIFNVGNSKSNYQIIQIANKVKEILPSTELVVEETKQDTRSYNISFNKLEKTFGFTLDLDMEFGIRELAEFIKDKKPSELESSLHSNFNHLQKIFSHDPLHEAPSSSPSEEEKLNIYSSIKEI